MKLGPSFCMLVIFIPEWIVGIVTFIWLRIIRCGSYQRARRGRRRRDDALQRLFLKPTARNLSWHPLTRPSSRVSSSDSPDKKRDLFFGRLPPEIRRYIQLLAFGERTVYMDLQFQRPFNLVNEKPYPLQPLHAKIHTENLTKASHLNSLEGMRWRWFSCVCHRFPPKGTHLPLGRRCNHPWGQFREPGGDLCLTGSGSCNEWPGEWPGKCQIGIMGWLLSCRNAYIEGIHTLYSTNTIHIASPVLIRGLQDVIPQQRIAELASLEIVWDAKQLPLNLGFTSNRQSNAQHPHTHSIPTFSSLIYLRISFKALVYGEIDNVTGQMYPYKSKSQLADKLHDQFLPTIDRLLDRIVPPSTEVIVSCANWGWYELIDLQLIEKQGKEKTKPQRADIGGWKCWRVIPRNVPSEGGDEAMAAGTASDGALEMGSRVKSQRDGYWIHIPIKDTHLEPGLEYDWHRHELYNLGGKRYRHC